MLIIISVAVSCTRGHETALNCELSNLSIDTKTITPPLALSSYNVESCIRLQTPSQDVVYNANEIEFSDNKIYIFDQEIGKKLYVFDSKGIYKYSLGERGKAASEFYDSPTSFSVDKSSGDVYLFEAESKKIVVFDDNGKYKEVIHLSKHWPYGFKLLNNNSFAYAYRMKGLNNDYELSIKNKEAEEISNYFPLNTSSSFTPGQVFCSGTDEVFFCKI